MKDMIKNLAEMAVEEADGACKYAKLAVENKRENPAMAEAVANLAAQELTHMSTLMKSADAMAEAHRVATPEDQVHHEAMRMFLDYLREKQSETAAKAKMHLEAYKTL